jgi:DNA primase
MPVQSDYNDIKNNLKWRLVEYVQSQLGIQVSGRKKFSCPNPSHSDSSPSCVIYENTNGPYIRCFSCDLRGDIFELHSHLTGAPLSGPEFFTRNLASLAAMFGLPLPPKDLSPKDRYFEDVRQAYGAAEKLLTATPGSAEAQQRLSRYGWSDQTRTQLGIGSVNYEYFSSQMTALFDRQFLKKVGLLEPRIFGDHTLVFTIKDENGQPVGFSARNLFYEEAVAAHEQACREYGSQSPQATREKNSIPMKYFNSVQGNQERDGSPILRKGERLLGFHRAKLGGAPLYLVEGNADVATVQNAGVLNCAGLCSAGFTSKQLELILHYKIPHVVLCLDADEGGRRGVRTFLETLDRDKPPSWFLAEIMTIPAGEDDPDAFIPKYGIEAFHQLPRVDVFTWKLNQLSQLPSPQDFANRVFQMLMEETSPFRRFQMAEKASKYLKSPAAVLYDESFARSGKPSDPAIRFRLQNGILVPDPPIEKIVASPIKMIDCRATIDLGTGPKPGLEDDPIYYPTRI